MKGTQPCRLIGRAKNCLSYCLTNGTGDRGLTSESRQAKMLETSLPKVFNLLAATPPRFKSRFPRSLPLLPQSAGSR